MEYGVTRKSSLDKNPRITPIKEVPEEIEGK